MGVPVRTFVCVCVCVCVRARVCLCMCTPAKLAPIKRDQAEGSHQPLSGLRIGSASGPKPRLRSDGCDISADDFR